MKTYMNLLIYAKILFPNGGKIRIRNLDPDPLITKSSVSGSGSVYRIGIGFLNTGCMYFL